MTTRCCAMGHDGLVLFSHSHGGYSTATAESNKLCGRPPQYAPSPCKLTFNLLTLNVVSESRVTWATSVPILVFLGIYVLDLGPMYATDNVRRQTDRRQTRMRCYGKRKFRKLIIIHSPAETEPIGRRRSFSEAARPMAGRQ